MIEREDNGMARRFVLSLFLSIAIVFFYKNISKNLEEAKESENIKTLSLKDANNKDLMKSIEKSIILNDINKKEKEINELKSRLNSIN